jgi:hypothetical protein
MAVRPAEDPKDRLIREAEKLLRDATARRWNGKDGNCMPNCFQKREEWLTEVSAMELGKSE